MKCRLARWLHHIAYRLEGRCVVCHAGNGNHIMCSVENVYYFGDPHK